MEVCPLSRGVILPSGATPIRLITRRLSLFPSSFARTPIGSPHGSLSHSGEIRVYHVPQLRPDGLGLAYTPVARASAVADFGASTLATYLFGSSLSAGLACRISRRLRRFTFVDHTVNPSTRPLSGWQSQLPLAIWLPISRLRLHCPESFTPRRCRRRMSR